MMTEDGYGKGLAPAIFCCGAGTVRSDQWNRPRDSVILTICLSIIIVFILIIINKYLQHQK